MPILKIAILTYFISIFGIAGSWDYQDEQQCLNQQETLYQANQ